ncbi:hypothetical protein, partial [Mesoplasma seiffertii]|uniref:hypothetical protein n=1 Tax=Mesoplasma seiffertii TaxID=28224 RepID=UPI00056BD239
GKEFADETAAITAAKKTQLADGVELDGEPTNSDHTITIKVKAENGYKIADGQETTFTATWVQGKKDIDKEALIKNIEDFLGEGKFASIDEATKAINAAATAGDLIVEGVEVIMAKGDEPEGSKIQITVVNESEYNEVKEFFIDFEIKQSF